MGSARAAARWTGGDSYELFMGRWSRELARAFVPWLGVAPGRDWLEVGCGTGALTSAICDLGSPSSVVATDLSESFLVHARASMADPRVRFLTASVERLPARPGGYDAVVSSLVLNFLPDPVAALREMSALAADGGTVAACVWDYSDGMGFLRTFWDVAVELDPAAREHDEGECFPICRPAALESAFRRTDLARVEVGAIEIVTRFRDFDDYWRPFVGGPGPAPGYVSSLPTEKRQELAGRLAHRLPRRRDGSIQLTARAWAARGEKRPGG